MRRFHARLAAMLVVAFAAAAFVAAAVADPGNGHGNSANAPGHQKQAQPAQQQQMQTSSSAPGTKPSSTTSHDTDTKVGASPDVSKRYGNGTTAAQIAKSRGAPDSQPLHGPGNSQPHKTFDCAHKSNRSGGVDVHAIKSYSATCATAASTKKAETPVKTPVKAPETPTTTAAQSEQKVTICHATGSATNPFVMITVDVHALKNGHTGAKGDIIPPTTVNGVTVSANWDTNGQAIFNNGCKPVAAAAAAAVTSKAALAPTTVTTTTPTTTTVAANAAVTTTVPVTTTVTVTTPTTTTVAANAAITTATTTTATVTTPTSTGGVKGAQTSLAKPKVARAKPHHGVLGTVTHVTGGTLPFTGFPIWLAVLIAAALILGGITLRRRTAGLRL